MKTIAMDALGIGQTGGGRSATLNVLRELLHLDRERRYLLLLDQPEPELAVGEHVQQITVPVHQRLLSRGWAQLAWPLALRRQRVDLVHHIKNLTTWGLPGRSVVTVYDLAIVLHPEIYPRSDVLYWRHVQPHALRAADRIIAISRQTADDLVLLYDLKPEAIRVIYPAYNPCFRPLGAAEAERVRSRYGTGPRFLLHVGSISRKKNLLTLLRAFERLCQRGYTGKLVLVGRQYGKGHDAAFYAHLERSPFRARVLFTGAVPDADLVALYNAAEMMVFPSLHEGYGIAPLEAMACGAPVITSNAGALPEVLGDGAVILEDATDADALAAAAEHVLADPAWRAHCVARGLARAARYTTAEAARQTLAVYNELL